MVIDRKLDSFMKHRTDKDYRTMWLNNGYSFTELRHCVNKYFTNVEEHQDYSNLLNKIHHSLRKTFISERESNFEVASILIYIVVNELKKFKTIYIPKNILPEDEFTEMLKNFCHVYRINIDRNQLCFIYENELNKTTAHKIKYWELD